MPVKYSGSYNNGSLEYFKHQPVEEFKEWLGKMGYEQGEIVVTQLVQENYNDDGRLMDCTKFGDGDNASIAMVISGLLSERRGKPSPSGIQVVRKDVHSHQRNSRIESSE